MLTNKVNTDQVVVVNTTTPTQFFVEDLGSQTSQKLYRLTFFGTVNHNDGLTAPTLEFEILLNGSFLTDGIATPAAGYPFYQYVVNVLFKDGGHQLAHSVLLTGESQDGDANDGATHLHLNHTTVDTTDKSVLSAVITLSAANASFGITNQYVLIEEVI